jgi:hypothetical protein
MWTNERTEELLHVKSPEMFLDLSSRSDSVSNMSAPWPRHFLKTLFSPKLLDMISWFFGWHYTNVLIKDPLGNVPAFKVPVQETFFKNFIFPKTTWYDIMRSAGLSEMFLSGCWTIVHTFWSGLRGEDFWKSLRRTTDAKWWQ